MGQQPQKTNTLALIGFITSLVCCGTPVGLILSIIGLNQIKKNPLEGGKGLATAGVVIGAIGMVIAVIYYIVVIAASINSSY
jgi:hypothetical protein